MGRVMSRLSKDQDTIDTGISMTAFQVWLSAVFFALDELTRSPPRYSLLLGLRIAVIVHTGRTNFVAVPYLGQPRWYSIRSRCWVSSSHLCLSSTTLPRSTIAAAPSRQRGWIRSYVPSCMVPTRVRSFVSLPLKLLTRLSQKLSRVCRRSGLTGSRYVVGTLPRSSLSSCHH